MVFVACGLNYKTAPLKVRENISVAFQDPSLLENLLGVAAINEALILSTCNRTEVYCETKHPKVLDNWFISLYPKFETISPYFYSHEGLDGIKHTLRVASGLDSMMLGESQILGQMKKAYQYACKLGYAKTNLKFLFQYVFRASKHIRNKSGIGTTPISIAYAAMQLVKDLFSQYQKLKILIIGSGETATLVAKYLYQQGVKDFFIASRTSAHATNLAKLLNGEAITIGEISDYLAKVDVVISATSCPLPFIDKNLVTKALIKRQQRPMVFLDLAMPCDVEEDVAELPNVRLYNIDFLQSITLEGMSERYLAAQQAERLIELELRNYAQLNQLRRAKASICNYRSFMQKLAQQELKRAEKRFIKGDSNLEVLHEFCFRLVNKLTHYPTLALRDAALTQQELVLDLASSLFTIPIDSNEEIT